VTVQAVCGTCMHSVQSKERAGGLCLDHLGFGLSAQVGSMLIKYNPGFWCWPYCSFVLQLPAGVFAGCSMCALRGWLRCWVCTLHNEFLADALWCRAGVHTEWRSWTSPWAAMVITELSCFALGTALQGIKRIGFLLAMALKALSTPPWVEVEALNPAKMAEK